MEACATAHYWVRELTKFKRPHSKAEYMTALERFADSQIPLAWRALSIHDPKAIEAMNTAFAATCKSLQLVNRDDPMTQIVARKIIDIARIGERDPQRLHDLALLALKESDQRSA